MSTPNPDPAAQEAWSATAPNYSKGLGQVTTSSANMLVEMGNTLKPLNESYVLDVGAGTGAVTLALKSKYPNTKILATDITPAMLQTIAEQILPNVATQIVDARGLTATLGKDRFSHVFSSFMLQTILTPVDAVREMYKVVIPGGVVGIAIWGQHLGALEIWREAVRTLFFEYRTPPPFDDERAWRTSHALETGLKAVGFEDVSIEHVRIPSPFTNVESFIEAWFDGKNPTAEKMMIGWLIEDLERVKVATEELLREKYGDGKDFWTEAVLGVGRRPRS